MLSATESEYIALSSAMRDLIPLRRLAKTIATSLGTQDLAARMRLTVFQDDNACLSQARSPRYTTRLHFFREPAKDVILEKIDTTISLAADIFTKGLTAEPINEPRKLLLGWLRLAPSPTTVAKEGVLGYIRLSGSLLQWSHYISPGVFWPGV